MSKAVSTQTLFQNADFDNILKCVHCGLCLDNCPTYRELGDEKDSPRGRLYLMRGLWQGDLELEPSVIEPLSRCLDSRACERACPSGVPYGQLLEQTRGIIQENQPQSWKEKFLRFFLLRGLFQSTALLTTASKILKIYAASGVPKLITNTPVGKIFPKSFVFQQYLLPDFSGESFKEKHADQVLAPEGNENSENTKSLALQVGIFSGCVMDVSEKAVHVSTLKILRQIGCEVTVPGNQVCCGALHVHSGDRDTARSMALKNLDAFGKKPLDAIITNAAGCGAQLKEYHLLFQKNAQNSGKDWSPFESKVVDILEFLSRYPEQLANLDWKDQAETVLYDAPCHLIHAQQVDENPRRLLNDLPGVCLVPLNESNWCCGSGGIYNLVQPELSAAVLKRKVDSLKQTMAAHPSANTIITGNPGCLYQIRAGIRNEGVPIRVLHPVVYLAERLKS